MSNTEDFEAIKSFFSGQVPKTAKGVDIKTSFVNWSPSVSTLLGTSDSDLNKAKQFRDDYNMTESPAATAAVKASPGLTVEETKYVLGMPVVNTTGMSPEAASKAVWSAKPNSPAPAGSAFAVGQKTAPSVAASAHKTIKQGSNDSKTSSDVAAWQKILGINADGKFGAQTAAATKTWQKNHGLKEDGIVGPTTWAKAEEVANPNGSPVVAPASQVAAVTGQNTVKPAVAAAKGVDKPVVATATTGAHALGGIDEPSNFQKAVTKINTETKAAAQTAEAGMLSGFAKVPKWGWAGIVGIFLAAAGYSIWGKPKYDQRKKS